jgi:DNA-binding MarR family transcriptional regulator
VSRRRGPLPLMTEAAADVLHSLRSGPLTAAQIAEYTRIELPAVRAAVSHLQRLQLVERRQVLDEVRYRVHTHIRERLRKAARRARV